MWASNWFSSAKWTSKITMLLQFEICAHLMRAEIT